MEKVLVLGGGFAGVEAAIFMRKKGLEVTLVSDRDYFYIYPTSIWIPTGDVTREDISIPLDKLAMKHGFQLIVDPVVSLNAKEKEVTLASGRVLNGYPYIVLAMGQDKLHHKGMEHTLSICGKPEEATALYEKLDALVLKGEGKIAIGFGGNVKDTSSVRGGPAFEVLFNIHHYLEKKGLRESMELTFFAPMEKPGQKMGDKALVAIDKIFENFNIHKKVGSKITHFEEEAIVFEDGTRLESDLTMFISAGKGHSILEKSGLPLSNAGYVESNEYNEVEGHEGIYAIGDATALMGPTWRAKQGHIAEAMARNVAYNILMHMQKIDSRHSYMEHLNILCVMDMGSGAAFVYRSETTARVIPMPLVGHWMKKGWGWYCRHSKLGNIPRIPGL